MLCYCANLKAIRYESTSLNRIVADKSHSVIVALSYNYTMRFIGYDSIRLQLHCAIYRPDSFVLILLYFVNLKAIRYESTIFNRIVADKSHRVTAA